MEKQLVLVGGGHAHMLTLANLYQFLDRGHSVTVIGPSPYHYYSGMGPGMLGNFYTPEEIRFATKHVVEKQGGKFILGHVTRISPEDKRIHLESGENVSYDVLSFNTGSYVPRTNVIGDSPEIVTVKPIEKLLDARKRILALLSEKKMSVGIIGGGPSAIEVAGNIWRLSRAAPRAAKINIFCGRNLMARFPEKLRQRVFRSLHERDIVISENSYAREIAPQKIVLENGQSFHPDMIFLAPGVKPSPVFRASGLPTGPDGGLRVNQFLQCPSYPELFGGGDCIYFEERPLNKVGVYAVRQNPILFHNLMASLENAPLRPFDPGGDYLLIFNMGDGTGILRKKWLQFSGKPAFFIKDYIDRRFMKRFQAIE